MKRFNCFKILYIVFIVSFGTAANFAQEYNIKIIETSDVHGAIFPYDFQQSKKTNNSLAHVYSYVKEERQKDHQSVILVDNGDILQGDPSVYYYNFIKPDTLHLLAQVMNYMDYDLGVVGNHDIETGHDVYDKFNKEINFPWLAANAIENAKEKPYFKPYHIKKINITTENGVDTFKVAFLGLITPRIPNWLPEKIWEGIIFKDMIITSKKWLPIIKQEEHPDLIVGVFHSGVDYTYGNQTEDMISNENASILVAKKVPGFDIIFVGHDHNDWNFKVANASGDSVLILGPASRARSIPTAIIKLKYNSEANKWEKNILGEIVPSKLFTPDSLFLDKFNNEFKLIKNFVQRKIGEFSKNVSAKNSLFGNSSFVDLIHKIQLDLTDADISLTAPLSIYTEIDSGDVFVKDMFSLYRYENLLYTMLLTGQEIKDYLEYSYGLWFNTINDKNDNLLKFKTDENGNLIYSKRSKAPLLENRYYNFDSAEGINYMVDVTKPVGSRVKISSLSNGEKFELEKKYRVAINSYRGNGGGGHLEQGAAIEKAEISKRIITSTEKDLRYYMLKWIEKNKIVHPTENINWTVEPSELVKPIIKKDYELMFGDKK